MAERNDGKRLEQLVATIEGMDLPAGFSVETNAPVYRDGQQIAELDILITGQIGSVTYRTLFECRDRPSQGAAPAAWIEQLYGRKKRMEVDVIVGVSTTGFSPDAIAFAQREKIPLRTVESLTECKLCDFLPIVAPTLHQSGYYSAVHIAAAPENCLLSEMESPEARYRQSALSTDQECFLNLLTNKLERIGLVWASMMNVYEREIFSDVPIDGPEVEKTIEATPDFMSRYRILYDEKRLQITKLQFTAVFRRCLSPMPLAFAAHYCGDTKSPTTIAQWKGEGPEGLGQVNVTIMRRGDALPGS